MPTQQERINELIQYLQSPRADEQAKGHELEGLLITYLDDHEEELEACYQLVLLYLHTFNDAEGAVAILQDVYERLGDQRSLLLTAYLQQEYLGGVEETVFRALEGHLFEGDAPAALSLLFQALYFLPQYRPYQHNGIKEKVTSLLEQSLTMDPRLTISYMHLGELLREPVYYKKAVTAVKSVKENVPGEYGYDPFSMDEYFEYMVSKKVMDRAEYDRLLFKAGGSAT